MSVRKYVSFAICLLFLSRSDAEEAPGLEGKIRVKELNKIGLKIKDVVSDFGNQVGLDPEEYVYFKTHQEPNIIDISTFDGHFRSFDGSKVESPKNLVVGTKLSPESSR